MLFPPPHLQTSPDLPLDTRQYALKALQHLDRFGICPAVRDIHIVGQVNRRSSMFFSSPVPFFPDGKSTAAPDPNESSSDRANETQIISSCTVLILSAIQSTPCAGVNGDHINLLSILNKQRYAQSNHYDFHLSTIKSRPSLNGPWNKVALIQDALNGTFGEYTWVVWMDVDTLIVDFNFILPLDRYEGKDLVMWGQEKELFDDGDAHMGTHIFSLQTQCDHFPTIGLNTGVMFIRNTEWTKDLFEKVSRLGTQNGKEHEKVCALFFVDAVKMMRDYLSIYQWALFDQNGFAYELKLHQHKKHVFLEQKIIVNGYWKDFPPHRLSLDLPFLKHFMGCQFCSGINKNQTEICHSDFMESFAAIEAMKKLPAAKSIITHSQ